MSSVDGELHALRHFLATEPVAVYVPELGRPVYCPNLAAPPHRCEREFDVPRAWAFAEQLRRAGQEAHVLVYGMPWIPKDSRANMPPTSGDANDATGR